MLKSIEDIFHLDHIGYAADDPRIHYSLDTIGEDENVFFSGPGRGHQFSHDPGFKLPWLLF